MKKILTLLAAVIMTTAVMAVPARKGLWRTITLTDGTTARVTLVGDEHLHFLVDQQGQRYTLDTATGRYHVLSETGLASLRRKAAARRNPIARRQSRRLATVRQKVAYSGAKKGLVILMQFPDTVFASGHNQALYNNMLNTKGYNKNGFDGSVADYFSDQSNGEFQLTFDVVGPYTASHKASYYGQNDSDGNDMHPAELIREACKAADADVDFSKYDWDGDGEVDQVFVLYAGKGEADGGTDDTIWPHEWELAADDAGTLTLDGVTINTYACGQELDGMSENNALSGIGTFCHEFSHCLGFPDMYDTSYSGWFGMGHFDLMDSGSYNGDSNKPAGYTSWEKWVAGWLTPQELTADDTTMTFTLNALSQNGGAYIIYNKKNRDEYYLLENRQQVGWDAELPDNGLLIMHVDYDEVLFAYNYVNTYLSNSEALSYARMYGEPFTQGTEKQRMTIFHADDNDDSDYFVEDWGGYLKRTENGDLYPYNGNNELTNTSSPAATLNTQNSDGTYNMNCAITAITQNNDGTVSFTYGEAATNNGSGTTEDPTVTPENGVLLHETFDKCEGSGGNDGSFSGNVANGEFKPDLTGWTATNKYGAYKCARFGSSKVQGEVTSPKFTLTAGHATTLSFRAACWDSNKDGTSLGLSASGNVTLSETSLTMKRGTWTDFTITLTGSGTTAITFTPGKRFFLDEVKVVDETTASGINAPRSQLLQKRDTRVFNLSGQIVGMSLNGLPHGIYIVGGKKVVK